MNEALSSNRYSLIELLEVDDATLAHLMDIVRGHYKLALEHGKRQTSAERRSSIRAEIETLRSVRESFIIRLRVSQYSLSVNCRN